jgi:hypothetical protein
MADEWSQRVEATSMSAQGARVIDLTEYRRRRAAKTEQQPTAAAVQPVLWIPVLLWVPLWPIS